MNHTKSATTKQINIPDLSVRIIEDEITVPKPFLLAEELYKLTVNILLSLQLPALGWYPPSRVPVISFLYSYSNFDPIFMFQEHLADITI